MSGSPGANLETRFPTQVVDLGVVPGKTRGWGSGAGKGGSQYRGYSQASYPRELSSTGELWESV